MGELDLAAAGGRSAHIGAADGSFRAQHHRAAGVVLGIGGMANSESRDHGQAETENSSRKDRGVPGKRGSALRLAQVSEQPAPVGRVAQAPEGLGFQLPRPLAGDAQLLPDLFQRVDPAVRQPVPQLQGAALARRQTPRAS